MALRRTIAKRFFNRNRDTPPPISIQTTATRNVVNRDNLTGKTSFLSRFLHRRSTYQQSATLPEFLSIPVGDKLRERLWPSSIAGNGIRLDEIISPENIPARSPAGGLYAGDLKKIFRSAQLEKVRAKLREISVNAISYDEFLDVCIGVCGNRGQGVEWARLLDEAGNVVVLGQTVFLRPDQVAKAMEKLIYQSIAIPNDPRKEELEQMKTQKAQIDHKAEALVRRELYCGLGFLVIQTMGFMRLTFWELSWDVMEPICFFVTSLHFALAYGFFIRTSKEPTFEGYFQRRLKVKQAKLMKTHNFDMEKYEELCKAFYPKHIDDFNRVKNLGANVVI